MGDWLRVPFPTMMAGRKEYGSGKGRGRGRGRGRGGGRGSCFDEEVENIDLSISADNGQNKEVPEGG